MYHSEVKISGILLAGGMSTRMGREKGMVKLGNRHLYEYPLKVLEEVCDEILISTCHRSVLPATYPMVCDEVEGIGPMGGIYTCLKYSSNDVNIILSYDMPGVSPALINYLILNREDFDVVVPGLDLSHPEPLCGVYRKKTASVFEACIQRNEYAVHRALNLSRSKVLKIEDSMSFWNPYLFININRGEDIESIPPDFGDAMNEN